MKTSWRDYSRYGVYTLGLLCLWQCFCFLLSTGYMEEASVVVPNRNLTVVALWLVLHIISTFLFMLLFGWSIVAWLVG